MSSVAQDQIERVRADVRSSDMSPEAQRLAHEQLDAAAVAANGTPDKTAALVMLGLANTLAMVNLNMDSARYSKETKNNIAVAIQEHHTACMSVTPRNPAPMSQWSMGEIFAWFRRSPLIHYCVATVLGAIGLWLAKTAPAPVAPTAATAATAAVAQTAAVAMPSTATAEVLRQFAGQLAMEFAKELRSNDVGRVRGNL